MIASLWDIDEATLWALGTWSSLTLPFWLSYGLVNVLCVKWGYGTKVQPGKAPSQELISKTMRETLLNHFLVHPLTLILVARTSLKYKFGVLSGPLPGLLEVVVSVASFFFVNDTLFYWIHRAFHSKLLYRRFHKQHHEYHTPIGISSEYAGLLEATVANLMPIVAGPAVAAYFFGSVHALTLWVWIALRIWETVDAHCGYEVPFPFAFPFSDVLRHDWHHSANNGNYGGVTLFWDWAMGTDTWAYAQRERGAKDAAKMNGQSETTNEKKLANGKLSTPDKAPVGDEAKLATPPGGKRLLRSASKKAKAT